MEADLKIIRHLSLATEIESGMGNINWPYWSTCCVFLHISEVLCDLKAPTKLSFFWWERTLVGQAMWLHQLKGWIYIKCDIIMLAMDDPSVCTNSHLWVQLDLTEPSQTKGHAESVIALTSSQEDRPPSSHICPQHIPLAASILWVYPITQVTPHFCTFIGSLVDRIKGKL